MTDAIRDDRGDRKTALHGMMVAFPLSLAMWLAIMTLFALLR